MTTPKLTPETRLALLMHGCVNAAHGKMGYGLMRYGLAPTVVVIDRETAGGSLRELTGIACDAPIVATVAEALAYKPDVIVPAIAPTGGALPPEWVTEVKEALAGGMSVLNGLHKPMADDPELAALLKPHRFIWDVRKEPAHLVNGLGHAREARAKRVLVVGTDMACGKMTAALEMDRGARAMGLRSHFLATGQIGIAIAGEGVALDAVRVDFATGAIEQMVMRHADDDIVFVEGQGSLFHPASTATLPLMRGSMPTHLVLCHRAGQEHVRKTPWVKLPPLREVVRLYETVCSSAGAFPRAPVAGIAVNCGHLSDDASARACAEVEAETGLPAVDVVRSGGRRLVEAVA